MKQRIRVVGIIRTNEGVLILKRNRGRSEAPVFWELPTSKIRFGEQPEEAIARAVAEYTGLSATSVKLKDVITFIAPEGASRLNNLYIIYEIGVPDGARLEVPHARYTAYKFIKDFSSSGVHLSEPTISVLEIVDGSVPLDRANSRTTANSATIHVDGASRGNPGPSGIGYCIYDVSGRVLEKGGEFIGFATSRVAEYYAMKKGIDRALDLGIRSARFISDSLMVVNQLNGIFKVKNQDIVPIYEGILRRLPEFENVTFSHVSRSQNLVADTEANKAIDNLVR